MMNVLWYVVIFARLFLLNCEGTYSSLGPRERSSGYWRIHSRLNYKPLSEQYKQKRQLSYDKSAVQHIFQQASPFGEGLGNQKGIEKSLDSAQRYNDMSNERDETANSLFTKQQTDISKYEDSSEEYRNAHHLEDYGNSPLPFHPSEKASFHFDQEFPRPLPGQEASEGLHKGPPIEVKESDNSLTQSQGAGNQQMSSGLRGEEGTMLQERQKDFGSLENERVPLPNIPGLHNLQIVKKFYPVEIVQKIPKPIPVTHTKLVPVPVPRKVIQYFPRPFPRLFSRHPDVHLSYIHYENRANPCQHGGIIVQSLGGYTCLCRKAYKGKHCQEKDHCYPYPCDNGGDCVALVTHYQCKCTNGFKGINCEVKDKCHAHPCKNGGTCIQTLNEVTCSCAPGYKGQYCQDIDYCHPNPCRNGGKCNEVNMDALCMCTADFKGPRCQVPKTCTPNLCRNGGVCVEERPSEPCDCAPGFAGPRCNKNVCEPNPCQHDGVCYSSKSDYNNTWNADCKCHGTYKGRWCRIANPCASNPGPCVHGICYDEYTSVDNLDLGEDGFVCHCYEGYQGTYCREKKCSNCDRNARCVNGQCVCKDGFQGDGHDCNEIRDLCFPNPCENGGTCHSEYGSFECRCAPGFKGKTCQDKTPCSKLDNPCKNGGTCIEDKDSYYCICPNGVRGKDCSSNSTALCDSHPCLNGGTCKVSEDNNNWYCECRAAHFKPPDCACNCPANAKSKSERNLVCDNAKGECTCPVGFQLNNYRDVCIDNDDDAEIFGGAAVSCAPNPCRNGGKCVTISDSIIKCICTEGWAGKYCEDEAPLGRSDNNPCEPNPCKNGGICSVANGSTAMCKCPTGFKPPLCEQKENTPCLPNPCQNKGQCTVVGESYDCACQRQFTGPNCQVDRCVKCDRLNGLCIDGTCSCKRGYFGNGYRCLPMKKRVIKICIRCHPRNAVCVNNHCQCKQGFIGNGYQCSPQIVPNPATTGIPWFKRSLTNDPGI